MILTRSFIKHWFSRWPCVHWRNTNHYSWSHTQESTRRWSCTEHFIYGRIQLAKFIEQLFNAVITVEGIPSCWKKDLIVPFYKGTSKQRKSPDSYKTIALLPCALKIFEKVLLTRIQTNILPSIKFQVHSSKDFQPKLGCLTASFNLQFTRDSFFHNIEHNSSILVAFLDTQKDFETVWRHGLMYKLHNLGISGALWSLINDCLFQHKLLRWCKSDQLRIVSCLSGCQKGRCTLYIPVSCVHLWYST